MPQFSPPVPAEANATLGGDATSVFCVRFAESQGLSLDESLFAIPREKRPFIDQLIAAMQEEPSLENSAPAHRSWLVVVTLRGDRDPWEYGELRERIKAAVREAVTQRSGIGTDDAIGSGEGAPSVTLNPVANDVSVDIPAKCKQDPSGEGPDVPQDDVESTLRSRVKTLHRCADSLVVELRSDDAAYGAACDAFTSAAKDVAKTMLEERVRRSFAEMTETHLTPTDAEIKISHARQIRDWLSPWSLAFQDAETGNAVQLIGQTAGSKQGSYRLYPIPRSAGPPVARWSRVISVAASPSLVDISHLQPNREKKNRAR